MSTGYKWLIGLYSVGFVYILDNKLCKLEGFLVDKVFFKMVDSAVLVVFVDGTGGIGHIVYKARQWQADGWYVTRLVFLCSSSTTSPTEGSSLTRFF